MTVAVNCADCWGVMVHVWLWHCRLWMGIVLWMLWGRSVSLLVTVIHLQCWQY